jgi:hypothetical protein
VPLAAIPASLRHYAATLPQFCLMLPRPSLMWLVGEGEAGPRTILACLGPLARFLPPGAGRTLGAFLATEVEGWKSVAAHEAAFAGRQGRTRLTAFGRRWQLTVTPIFGTNGDVVAVVGSAILEPPDEEAVRAIYAAMRHGRRMTLVAVVDLPEHGLREGDELAVAPATPETPGQTSGQPAALDPRTFADLVTAGLLVPSVPIILRAGEEGPEGVSLPSGVGVPASPSPSPRLGRPSGPTAIPVGSRWGRF